MKLLAKSASQYTDAKDEIDATPMELGVLSPEDRQKIVQNRFFERSLYVTQALLNAWDNLQAQTPGDVPPARLGMILATDRGDRSALASRMESFARYMQLGEIAPPDLFRAISYFPTGRVLKTIADRANARGPIVTIGSDVEMARQIATIWLACGRADRVIVATGEMPPGGGTASATMELLEAIDPPGRSMPTLVVTGSVTIPQRGDDRRTDLGLQAIEELSGNFHGKRVALIFSSMLGQAGEELFATVSPHAIGSDLLAGIGDAVKRHNFTEVFTPIGSSGGVMVGLALVRDLIALNRIDAAVLCGMDLVSGALATALGLLHCQDLAHMHGGAIAVFIEPAEMQPLQTDVPQIHACTLFSPKMQMRRGYSLDLYGEELSELTRYTPTKVVLSGLNEMDFDAAENFARILWPKVPIVGGNQTRSVGADLLRLIVNSEASGDLTAIVSVHSLGGTGVCLMSG
jgi:hypothetical protein